MTVSPRLVELDAQIEMHRDLNHQRAADYEARLLSLTIEAAALRIVDALNMQTERLVVMLDRSPTSDRRSMTARREP